MPLLYNHACLYQSLPPRRERRNAFPGSQVFGTGTLPVGFQGRSALVAEGEIPVQERGRLMFPVRIITKASSKNSTMEPVSSA